LYRPVEWKFLRWEQKLAQTTMPGKYRTLVVGYALALAVFLFAQHRSDPNQQAAGFRTVVDLTTEAPSPSHHGAALVPASLTHKSHSLDTRGSIMIAPASVSPRLWTVGQIPAERLIAPLVVLDERAATHPLSVEDIADWEHAHGQIPQGAVVAMITGRQISALDEDAAQFLVEGRSIVGMGSNAKQTYCGSPNHPCDYALAHSTYVLANIANLDRLPATGSVAIVAPAKLAGESVSSVRLLALVK